MDNKEKISNELKGFCESIEKWFRGAEKNQEALYKKIISGFSPEFKMINGDGNAATLALFSDWLPTVFGKFPDRRVLLENIEIIHSDHHGIATYTEIQMTGGTSNRRQSSAVFLLNEENALWLHLIENWV